MRLQSHHAESRKLRGNVELLGRSRIDIIDKSGRRIQNRIGQDVVKKNLRRFFKVLFGIDVARIEHFGAFERIFCLARDLVGRKRFKIHIPVVNADDVLRLFGHYLDGKPRLVDAPLLADIRAVRAVAGCQSGGKRDV